MSDVLAILDRVAGVARGSGCFGDIDVRDATLRCAAKEAAAEGLLDPGAFEAILRERLAAIRVGKMQATRQKMVSAAMPPMAAKEIEAEIKAYRAERRRAAGT